MQACLAGIAFDASLLFVDEMPICLLVPVVWFFCVSYRHSPCNRPTASPLAILCACAYSVSCLIVPFSLFVFYQKKKNPPRVKLFIPDSECTREEERGKDGHARGAKTGHGGRSQRSAAVL